MVRKKRNLNDEMKEYYSNANAKPGRKQTDLNSEMLEYFYNANVNGGGGGGGEVSSVNGKKGVVVLGAEDIKSDDDYTPTNNNDLTDKKYLDKKIGEIAADKVTSVNGYTGAVVLSALDVPAPDDYTPSSPNDITSKKYVDEEIAKIPTGGGSIKAKIGDAEPVDISIIAVEEKSGEIVDWNTLKLKPLMLNTTDGTEDAKKIFEIKAGDKVQIINVDGVSTISVNNVLGNGGDQSLKRGWLTIDSSENFAPYKPAGLSIRGQSCNGHFGVSSGTLGAKLSTAFDGGPSQVLLGFVDFKRPAVAADDNWCWMMGYKNAMLIKRPRVEKDYTPEATNSLTDKKYVDEAINNKKNFDRGINLYDSYTQIESPVNSINMGLEPTSTQGYGEAANFTINYMAQASDLPSGVGDGNTLLTFNPSSSVSNQLLISTAGDLYIRNVPSSGAPRFKKVVTEATMLKREEEKDNIINDLLKRVEVLESKLNNK